MSLHRVYESFCVTRITRSEKLMFRIKITNVRSPMLNMPPSGCSVNQFFYLFESENANKVSHKFNSSYIVFGLKYKEKTMSSAS